MAPQVRIEDGDSPLGRRVRVKATTLLAGFLAKVGLRRAAVWVYQKALDGIMGLTDEEAGFYSDTVQQVGRRLLELDPPHKRFGKVDGGFTAPPMGDLPPRRRGDR